MSYSHNNQPPNHSDHSFFFKILRRLQKTLSDFINVIAESIINSVHIPEIAIGPIIGSLITSITTLIIGFLTISNIFSEQFLSRPLQIQDNNANYTLELDRYHQQILNEYLQQTQQLIINNSRQHLQQNPLIIKAFTHATLAELDGKRKRYLIMFLKDAFFSKFYQQQLPSILTNADLQEAELSELDLAFLDFQSSDFSKANLSRANLHQSNLNQANLTNANLTNADLRGVSLEKANLTNTNLTNACYDVFTKFDANFDLTKTKLRLINSFSNCQFIPINNKDNKQIISSST